MAKTIRDVAREAGVSIATVSRVINNSAQVREETLKRVVAAAEKLSFYPDHNARTLVSRKTKSVGLLVPTLLNEYWASFSESVQRALIVHGYSLFLGTLGSGSEEYMEQMLRSAIERKMDGLIFGAQSPNRSEQDVTDGDVVAKDRILLRKIAATLKRVGMPVISFGLEIPGFSVVRADHHLGGAIAADYLSSLGHRSFAYLGGNPFYTGALDPREMGFRDHVKRKGGTLKEANVRYVPFSIENGYAAACDLLDKGASFTALFCWNDLLAVGALNALVDRGRAVPQDVSIVGFDDISVSRITRPALTTIHQPIAVMGESTVSLLVGSMNSGTAVKPRKLSLKVKLVQRGSCGRAPGRAGGTGWSHGSIPTARGRCAGMTANAGSDLH